MVIRTGYSRREQKQNVLETVYPNQSSAVNSTLGIDLNNGGESTVAVACDANRQVGYGGKADSSGSVAATKAMMWFGNRKLRLAASGPLHHVAGGRDLPGSTRRVMPKCCSRP
jgi:hypothetical protein